MAAAGAQPATSASTTAHVRRPTAHSVARVTPETTRYAARVLMRYGASVTHVTVFVQSPSMHCSFIAVQRPDVHGVAGGAQTPQTTSLEKQTVPVGQSASVAQPHARELRWHRPRVEHV